MIIFYIATYPCQPNLTSAQRVGVVIIQPINDFSDKYMVPMNSEPFKTPSLTPHTLPNSNLSFLFFFILRIYSVATRILSTC